MGKRRLDDLARVVRLFGRPIRNDDRKPWRTAATSWYWSIFGNFDEAIDLPLRIGNTSRLPSPSARAAWRTSSALPHSGTRCSRFAFIRMAGTVHTVRLPGTNRQRRFECSVRRSPSGSTAQSSMSNRRRREQVRPRVGRLDRVAGDMDTVEIIPGQATRKSTGDFRSGSTTAPGPSTGTAQGVQWTWPT